MSQIVVYSTSGGGGGGFIKTVTGNMGGGIPPDGSGNVNIVGGHDIVIHGSANTLTVDVKNSIILGDLSPIVGSDAATFNTGDLSIIHGSIKLPSTTADSLEGVIYVNGDRFISDFGTMDNVFIGRLSGNFTNTGASNVGVGAGTFFSLTSGTSNVALGAGAFVSLADSSDNIGIGIDALEQLSTGTGQNVGIGSAALSGLQTGRNNIALGYEAGIAYTSSESSNILIGSPGVLGESNTLRIGIQGSSDTQQNAAYIAGILGVTVTNPAAVVIDSVTGQLGVGAPGTGPIETVTADTGGPLGPTAGNINILGAHGINTSGSVSTVTVAINNAITLGDLSVLTTGNNALTITSGNITLSGTGTNAAANINLPSTNSTGAQGVITVNSLPFISDFGTLDNVFMGRQAGNFTNTGSHNIGIGALTLVSLTSGHDNLALGVISLENVSSAIDNVAVGSSTLQMLTTGSGQNVAVGVQALQELATGASNIAVGMLAGINYTAAESSNILIGAPGVAAESNVIRIGTQGSSAGQQNTAFMAGIVGVTVSNPATVVINTATGQLGVGAGGASPIETITGNTGGALGPTAGNFNVVTANATVIFAGSGSTETLDFNRTTNLVLGTSLPALAGGANNVGMGTQGALSALTSGVANTVMGSFAALRITSSGGNTAIGSATLNLLTTGTGGNTAIGNNALVSLSTGSFNTALGEDAGNAYTGSESSNVLLANPGVLGESNVMRLGTTGSGTRQVNQCFIAGVDGVNVGSVATVVTESGTQLGTAVITAGSNITVTPGANTITISGTGAAGFVWSVVTSNQSAVVNNGYIANGAGTVALTLPTTSAVGSILEVTGINNATGWQIAQNAGQVIHFGVADTTTGVGGSLTSSATRDSIRIVCVVANLEWNVLSSIGNITVV